MRGKSGNWKDKHSYMDRNGAGHSAIHAPSLMLMALARLKELPPGQVWELCEGRLTYRTLLRWKKPHGYYLTRRIELAKWWLENRARLETLEGRGLFMTEIVAKVGLPPTFSTHRGALSQTWKLLRKFEYLENEYLVERHAA